MMNADDKVQEALKRHDEHLQFFVDKGRLLLTVEVTTKEQADELLTWAYSKKGPMKSELLSIAWDQIPVRKEIFEMLERLQEALAQGL